MDTDNENPDSILIIILYNYQKSQICIKYM